jgi:diguanylate cyclase (GGDEF)-like protein
MVAATLRGAGGAIPFRAVTFRGRLRLFFALIVIVPMVALAVVLFRIAATSEEGKADAAAATALDVALGVYREEAGAAEPLLRRVAADAGLRAAIVRGGDRAAMRRIEQLSVQLPGATAIELWGPDGRLRARSGSAEAVAHRFQPLENPRGQPIGTLAVSTTEAEPYVERVEELTGLDASIFRGGERLASTLPGAAGAAELGPPGEPRQFEMNGTEFRGRDERIREPAGPPVAVSVFRPAAAIDDAVSDHRVLIGGLLAAFLLLALLVAGGVVRALQGQIGTFLSAARRLARGDFTHPVPTHGRDEFAELGREFNSMSEQLETKIEEVERKKQELEETIRRVGDAFATGLDRHGLVELALRTAVDACEAEAGHAFPLEPGAFAELRQGPDDDGLSAAIAAAERSVFAPRADTAPELLEVVDQDAPPPRQRRALAASIGDAHALALPLRAHLASGVSVEYVGVLAIARREREFTREEGELLEYLAGQASVSIENASLHEMVQEQAVTDELTGLANSRALHAILEREIERGRRFNSPLALVMVDVDDFKRVNDTYGHQQGDEVLASVASVLRDLSRDIDAPARYGGEELAVVLPQTDSGGAMRLAERMREAVEAMRVPRVGGGAPLAVTASFGVAVIPDSASDKSSLIAAADAALYRAKRSGKNRVERAEPVAAAG